MCRIDGPPSCRRALHSRSGRSRHSTTRGKQMVQRCGWAGTDPLYIEYHDTEWGVPEHDDRKLFEMLILEGAQAGLSWITILRRREGYRRAFDSFEPAVVAAYDDAKVAELLQD